MDLLMNEVIVTKITNALFMSKNQGAPIHRDRATHGFAFNVDCAATYRFESGEVLTCHSGELIYLPKGSNYTAERYMERDTAARGVYAINFLTQTERNGNRPCVVKIKGNEKMISLFSRAARAWMKKESGFYEECMSDLYGILRLLKTEREGYAPVERDLSTLKPALEYIRENFLSETIPVERLACLCGVSEPYLRRLFHRRFSVSPSVYVRDLRIKYAKELLGTGEYTVTEAAALSGFNDVSYFSREFKKATGVSPRSYQ